MKRIAGSLCVGIVLSLVWAVCLRAEGPTKITFQKTRLDSVFRSEGAAVGDFNCDGRLDVAAGSVYYAAPDWKMHSVLEKPDSFDPKAYSNAFCCFAEDLSGDGRTDLIVVGYPGAATHWFENPGPDGGPWKQHLAVTVTNSESPGMVDLRGDGRRDLLFGYCPDAANPDGPQRQMAFARPGKDPRAPWPLNLFSAKNRPGSEKYAHGLGVGDVNGDGRNDVVIRQGWWEAPAENSQAQWTFHPANLGEDCAHMFVYDFDGDGDNDVFSTSAHRFGVWWHEQTPEGWKTHEVEKSISQLHAVCMVDLNGDGLPDFVTGKRWWAHGGHDPGAKMPAVVVWYELGRKDGRPVWSRHQIDDDSGVGTQFEVADLNADGLLDVVTSNKKGVFYFQQTRN